MGSYFVCEILGKQYNIEPGQTVRVDYLGDLKSFECDKVLLKVEDSKMQAGSPYLKEKVVFDVLQNLRERKVRVATYKAKANYRRVKGSRRAVSLIRLRSENREKA